MKNLFKQLEKLYGSMELAAVAIGYTTRRYRDFKNGKAPVPIAVKLAVTKLLEHHKQD